MTRVPFPLLCLPLLVACRSSAEPQEDPGALDMPAVEPSTVGWGGGTRGALPVLVREDDPPAEPIVLLAGRDLAGWKKVWRTPQRGLDWVWTVDEQGVLEGRGQPIGYLLTERAFGNYVLELEWRYSAVPGDSGVMVCVQDEERPWPRGLEVQTLHLQCGDVWTWGGSPLDPIRGRTVGQITRKTEDAEARVGDWNHYAIRVDRGKLTVAVNGRVVNELKGIEQAPGRVALKGEGVPMQFRNLRLTPLD